MPHEDPISLWGQLPARGANSNPGNGTAREDSAGSLASGGCNPAHVAPFLQVFLLHPAGAVGSWRTGLPRAGVTPRSCLCRHPQLRPHPVDPALPRAQDRASKADMELTRTSQWVPATCPHLDQSSSFQLASHVHSCPPTPALKHSQRIRSHHSPASLGTKIQSPCFHRGYRAPPAPLPVAWV